MYFLGDTVVEEKVLFAYIVLLIRQMYFLGDTVVEEKVLFAYIVLLIRQAQFRFDNQWSAMEWRTQVYLQ
jgi:hypothetical protein